MAPCLEEWRPVPSCPGYMASAAGEIRRPRGLRKLVQGERYLVVNVPIDGVVRQRKVHTMVCEAFHGPRPPGKVAAHNNGVRSDCSATNVRWATSLENAHDRSMHGNWAPPPKKLTQEQAERIRRAYAPGAAERLTEQYNVAKKTIFRIVAGKIYAPKSDGACMQGLQ